MKKLFANCLTLLFPALIGINRLNAQNNPCYATPPATVKEALTFFNQWTNDIKPGTAYLHYLLDTDIEDVTFKNASKKSISRIAPFLSNFKLYNENKCLIPVNISQQLSGGKETKLHYGMILPNPDKSIIVLYMMDDTESMGFTILDKTNYSVIQPWESFNQLLGTYIYDLELIGNKFVTYSYGVLMSGISSSTHAEYNISKESIKAVSTNNFDKKDPTKYFTKLPAIINFERDEHENVVAYYKKYGFNECGVLLYKTNSGINTLIRVDRMDEYNLAFEMAVMDNMGNIKGEWKFFYYFGDLASAETMMSFDADIRFDGDKITFNQIYSENGAVISNKTSIYNITANGIEEIKTKNEVGNASDILKSLNTINLPINIAASGRDQGIISGNDQFITLGKTLSEEERKILLPRSNWDPYDRTDVFTDEGRFVLLKTSDGTTIVAAWKSASLKRVLHLQVVDNQGNAIGEPLDFIVSGSTPNAMSGNSNGIEISMNGDITINLLAWVNDYNTGEALRDDKATRKMKITKNGGIIRQ